MRQVCSRARSPCHAAPARKGLRTMRHGLRCNQSHNAYSCSLDFTNISLLIGEKDEGGHYRQAHSVRCRHLSESHRYIQSREMSSGAFLPPFVNLVLVAADMPLRRPTCTSGIPTSLRHFLTR